MATSSPEVSENDYIELTRQVGRWPAGTRGTVVSDRGGVDKLIEVSDDRGQMLDLFVVQEHQLKLIAAYPSS